MFDNIKRNLYFSRMQLLLEKGFKDGSIVPFDDEFYEKMSHTYIAGLPVSMRIKYLRPIVRPGGCIERSLYMFFCFENAILVRGDDKYLELKYGKDNADHGWIEMDDYCYDPTLLLRFKRDVYYEIYKPSHITKTTLDEYKNYCDSNRQFYEDVVNTRLSDFFPYGRRRINLYTMIPRVREIAELGTNDAFKRELNNYLDSIQYDEGEVYVEMDHAIFQKCIKGENATSGSAIQ